MKKDIRLRFAPSPTGMMHLGNIRTALMNALFAKKKNGTFILRIEDTDQARNFDPGAVKIIEDLTWLRLFYDEGPGKDGSYGPYFQSERTPFYKTALEELINKGNVYRCFCTPEELEKRRARQIALKKPPRYDRACLSLTEDTIKEHLNAQTTFIWRYKLDQDKETSINDLAHGKITFDLKHFSDFPLTRGDHSFTFIFANFVDDMLMRISHVIRGEDHLTNTACQSVLFEAFHVEKPIFWHLPMLCNIEGKKLSKRDFGFSLRDLKASGLLPEAILNYLSIIGGGSFKDEIMSFDELVHAIDFDHIKTTGQVKFDAEKLKWMNNKWIARTDPEALTELCLPYLQDAYPCIKEMDRTTLTSILQLLKTDIAMLSDVVPAMRFYFEQPNISQGIVDALNNVTTLKKITTILIDSIDAGGFIDEAKKLAKEQNVKMKELFEFVRLGLMGSAQGPSIHDLLEILGPQESKKRLSLLVNM